MLLCWTTLLDHDKDIHKAINRLFGLFQHGFPSQPDNAGDVVTAQPAVIGTGSFP